MKHLVRIALVFAFAWTGLVASSNFAQAQKIDLAFGVNTTEAPGIGSLSSNSSHFPESLSGGTFPGVSGDVLFWHNVGVGAEVFWRASQASGNYYNYDGVNYRPLFFNFNAVYAPKLASHTYLELVGGLGALSTHFYECNGCAQFGGSSLVATSHHFDVDVGGGIKFYPKGGFFIRPEARFYWINNDTNYAGSYSTRVGASIGYTFGGH